MIDLYFAMGAQVIQRGIISSTQRCYFISLRLWFALKNDSVNFCVIFISTLLLLVSWKKIPSSRLSTFHEIESATRTNVKKWLDHNNLLIFSPGVSRSSIRSLQSFYTFYQSPRWWKKFFTCSLSMLLCLLLRLKPHHFCIHSSRFDQRMLAKKGQPN